MIRVINQVFFHEEAHFFGHEVDRTKDHSRMKTTCSTHKYKFDLRASLASANHSPPLWREHRNVKFFRTLRSHFRAFLVLMLALLLFILYLEKAKTVCFVQLNASYQMCLLCQRSWNLKNLNIWGDEAIIGVGDGQKLSEGRGGEGEEFRSNKQREYK